MFKVINGNNGLMYCKFFKVQDINISLKKGQKQWMILLLVVLDVF